MTPPSANPSNIRFVSTRVVLDHPAQLTVWRSMR